VLLVDTNIWLAAGDQRSRNHGDCAALLERHADELAATIPVIAETAWLLLDRGGPATQAAFVANITSGRIAPVDLIAPDWARILDLLETYADLQLDLIDASIIAVAERLGLTTIATLNHRDFSVVRPTHCGAFELVP
jgi:uncharacterized protein